MGNLQVSDGQVAGLLEGALGVDDLVDTAVGVEVGLDVLEDRDGTVCTPTAAHASQIAVKSQKGSEQRSPEDALRCGRARDTDGIVEGETKRLMDLFTTFTTVEKVLLDIVENGEEDTAGCVSGGTTVSASGLLDEGS